MSESSTPGPIVAPAGWYPHAGQQRYWNGTAWTNDFAPTAQTASLIYIAKAPPTTNGIATAGLTLGIVGVALAFVPFSELVFAWVPAVLAIIFGFVGLNRAKLLSGLNHGSALASVILGFVAVPLSFILFAILAAIGASIGSGTNA